MIHCLMLSICAIRPTPNVHCLMLSIRAIRPPPYVHCLMLSIRAIRPPPYVHCLMFSIRAIRTHVCSSHSIDVNTRLGFAVSNVHMSIIQPFRHTNLGGVRNDMISLVSIHNMLYDISYMSSLVYTCPCLG